MFDIWLSCRPDWKIESKITSLLLPINFMEEPMKSLSVKLNSKHNLLIHHLLTFQKMLTHRGLIDPTGGILYQCQVSLGSILSKLSLPLLLDH